MKATNIKWETDGEVINLPSEVEVADNLSDEEVADYLSDTYGWLVDSFALPTDEDAFGEYVN